MAELNLSHTTTTDFTNQVPNFIVESKVLDVANANKEETYVYYDKATENYGYYFNHAQVASQINSLCTHSFGLGWDVGSDTEMKVILEGMTGDGKDTFDALVWNHASVMIMNGDSFMEIIRNKKGELINLLAISPERVKTVYKGPRIIRYEIWNSSKWVTKKIKDIFHSRFNRIGDQVRGTSLIQTNKIIIDTMLEAHADERIIKHRDKALGIVYYKTNNEGKIAFANSAIEKAVKNGEMVGLPDDTAKIEPYPSKSSEDRQNWLTYNENLNLSTGGVPRSIVSSDGTSEVGGIGGQLIFEVISGRLRLTMENDFWSQLAIKINFNRAPSVSPKVQEDTAKNTGEVGIQEAEVGPSLNR